MQEHYFTKSPQSKLIIKKLKVKLRNKEIEFFTASGLFSISRVDLGSEILINKCIIEDNWKVLDLGCGYGIIGLALLKSNKTLKLTFSDINERAIQLTKKNLDIYKLKATVVQSNGFENIREKFNAILLNPPQTAGKELCFKLIENSKEYLEKNGLLQVVARHNKGGKELSRKMKEVFNNVTEISKSSGYRIYISKNSDS
ncbi:class I SAM-dependent methyltransferase [Candidatus Woesearchaeota archaeon]|nr:class I SAM-dependent methyltransferase [Candidatus Woesearchaeota archaeon]